MIAGGDRLSGTDQSFSLDASDSNDPDELLLPAAMYFSWTCQAWDPQSSYDADSEQYTGGYTGACTGAIDAYMVKGSLGGFAVNMPQGTLSAGLVQFTVFVSDSSGDSSTVAGTPSYSVNVEVKSGEPPTVAIEALDINMEPQAKFSANEGEYMTLRSIATAKLFSVFVNSCKDCGCGVDMCVDCSIAVDPVCTQQEQDWYEASNYDRCKTCPEPMVNKPDANIGQDWLVSLLFAMTISFLISQPISILMTKAIAPQLAYKFFKGKWKKTDAGQEDRDIFVAIRDEHEVMMKEFAKTSKVKEVQFNKAKLEEHKRMLAQAGISATDDEMVAKIIVQKKEGKKKKRRRKKKKSGDVALKVEDVKEEEDVKEKKEDGEEVEDVRLVGVKDVEKKEKVKLDVNPLKNKTRAQIMEGKDPDDVVDNYDFGYEVDGDDVEARRAQFKKEAKLTKDMLDARQPVDDAGAGRTDDLMNLFVEVVRRGRRGEQRGGGR